jgi:hypothetical protein
MVSWGSHGRRSAFFGLRLDAVAIDAAPNTSAALHLGPAALDWLHACYRIGAATGPMA